MRQTNFDKILPILEHYPAIQCEGSRAGRPTIIIRTTGCTHRCWFGDGGWCDSWYTSIHPEKGKYAFGDIVKMYEDHPHIKEMLLTGGSPTMHPALVNELTCFAHENKIFVTLETEGSHFVRTDYPINLISLSPKFGNSVPKAGITTPGGKRVDQKFIETHNKYRLNHDAIRKTLEYHSDYHVKPVIDKEQTALEELLQFIEIHHIPNDKIWLMPAGDTREKLIQAYPVVMKLALERGWNFTGRPQIIAYDTQRGI